MFKNRDICVLNTASCIELRDKCNKCISVKIEIPIFEIQKFVIDLDHDTIKTKRVQYSLPPCVVYGCSRDRYYI